MANIDSLWRSLIGTSPNGEEEEEEEEEGRMKARDKGERRSSIDM